MATKKAKKAVKKTAKKISSKELKSELTRAGEKLPHGYEVKNSKRK